MNNSENNSKTLTDKEQIVLEQLRQHHRETIATFRALDGKALTILEVSSLVVTITAGLQIANSNTSASFILFVSLLFYAITVLATFVVLSPKSIKFEPLVPKWDQIRDSLKQEDHEFFLSLLSGYEDSISHNMNVNDNKVWYFKLTIVCLGCTVVLSVLTILLRPI